MIALVWIVVIACGVTARPNAATTPGTHPTAPRTTNVTTKPTTPMCHNRPRRCPTQAALIADFISKSKYHFKALQIDHQGYYDALKWNLDGAFRSLEGQFGNLISDVQYDMKKQFTNVQKQNDALKSQNAIIKSQNDNLKSQNDAIKSQNDNLKSQNDAIKSQNDNLKSQNTDIKSQNDNLKSQLTQTLSAVKNEIKSQNTALKQQLTDGLKTLTDHVSEQNCAGGRSVNGVCYKIFTCSSWCNLATAKQMCNKIGATLAPLRSATIYNAINNDRKQLGISYLWIDGSDAATEGTWRYYDGTPMSYKNWQPGQPNEGTSANNVYINGDKMYDATPSTTHDGVACAWE